MQRNDITNIWEILHHFFWLFIIVLLARAQKLNEARNCLLVHTRKDTEPSYMKNRIQSTPDHLTFSQQVYWNPVCLRCVLPHRTEHHKTGSSSKIIKSNEILIDVEYMLWFPYYHLWLILSHVSFFSSPSRFDKFIRKPKPFDWFF